VGTSIPRVARLALSILFTLAAGAGADEIIYDNGAATAEGGSAASDFDFPSQVTDDFILFSGLPTRVGRIDWWGQYVNNNTPTAPDDFTIRVFNDSPEGTPLSVPFVERRVGHVGRSNAGPFSHGFDTYAYSASFEPIILAPDTWYWLSIVNDTSGDANDDWFWSRHLKSQGNFFIRAADGSTWNGPIRARLRSSSTRRSRRRE
jgi:hypothetical protein